MMTETPKTTPERRDSREPAVASRLLAPRLDIVEGEEAYQAIFEMPGVPEANVQLTVERGVLRVEGKTEAAPYEGYDLTYAEHRGGTYQRSLRLGDTVDASAVSAHMKAGLLYVTLPKRKEAKARRIEVKGA